MFLLEWIDFVYSVVWNIRDVFFAIYGEVQDWVWPFYWLASPFYSLYLFTNALLAPIAHFYDWVYTVWQRVEQIITEFDIWSILATPIQWAQDAWNWVRDAWLNVWIIVGDWWSATSQTVKGWIDTAVQGFNDLVVAWNNFWTITWPEWTGKLDAIRSDLDNFFTQTLPTLFDVSYAWTWWGERRVEVQELISSNLKEWFPFYDDLVAIWGEILEFFTNPLEFLLNHFFDWFLGPEA